MSKEEREVIEKMQQIQEEFAQMNASLQVINRFMGEGHWLSEDLFNKVAQMLLYSVKCKANELLIKLEVHRDQTSHVVDDVDDKIALLKINEDLGRAVQVYYDRSKEFAEKLNKVTL